MHLKRTIGLVIKSAFLLAATRGGAQLVFDGATNVLSSSTNLISGNLIVGTNKSDTLLILTNGARVANSGGIVGLNSGATNSRILVIGTNSTWANSSDLYVGNRSSGNAVLITDGGSVLNNIGYLGFNAGANHNHVVVAGTRSGWTNALGVYAGYAGSGSVLVITNGGKVAANTGCIGFGVDATSNSVVVSGANSLWTNAVDLAVANSGSRNMLLITNSGRVMSVSGSVGAQSSAASNQVIVTGANSLWGNGGQLSVGTAGSFNSMLLTNGGRVANRHGYIGYNSGANGNQAIVTGSSAMWTNLGDLQVGSRGSFNTLLLSGGGRVLSTNGFVGYDTAAVSNQVRVTGSGSVWSNHSELRVGQSGSGNLLTITNGGRVVNNSGYVGYNSAANGNRVVVTGTGSVWTNLGDAFVGHRGSFNTLLLTNRGQAVSRFGYIGREATAVSNQVIVTGSRSSWTNTADLVIGHSGARNAVLITNSGTVQAANALMGLNSSSSSNVLTVGNGTLIITGTPGAAVLDVRRGSVIFNGGTIATDRLLLTNGIQSQFAFNAGTLQVGAATVANGSVFTAGNGTSPATYLMMDAATRSHTFAGDLLVSSNATLAGNGVITGSVTNRGTIGAGISTGSLRVNGHLYLASSSRMAFEIGGPGSSGQYDQIIVTNNAHFAGTLNLSLIDGYLPSPSDRFTLFRFASYSGAFANAPDGGRVSLSNGLASFAVTYGGTNLVLHGVEYVDTDNDGVTDLEELATGTDPNDPTSRLKIESLVWSLPGSSELRFQAVTGRSYLVEYSSNLLNWAAAGPAVSASTNGLQIWTDDGTLTGGLTPTRFYRLQLAPP